MCYFQNLLMSLMPLELARKRYQGKVISNKQYAELTAKLLLGNTVTNTAPKTITEIAVILGYKKRESIYRFRELALKLHLLETDDNGDIIKPKLDASQKFAKFVSTESFCKDPLIESWVNDLKHRKNGAALASSAMLINRFKVTCNTLKVNPSEFLTGDSNKEVLAKATKLIENFLDLYMNNAATVSKSDNAKPERVAYNYSKATRDFMAHHGFSYARGTKGVMGQSVALFHGNYADVKLSDAQIEEVEKYIIDNWGLDSDIFRWFFIGLESCARKLALFGMQTNYEIVMMNKKPVYVMTVFESKTKHIKKGKWEKYITRKNTQKSIDLVKKRSNFVIEERDLAKIQTEIYAQLRQIYKHLQIDKLHLEISDDDSTGYFMQHATHALRHCGAHLWLRRTDYRYEIVADIGGWNTIDEVRKSYGEMPANIKLEILGKVMS